MLGRHSLRERHSLVWLVLEIRRAAPRKEAAEIPFGNQAEGAGSGCERKPTEVWVVETQTLNSLACGCDAPSQHAQLIELVRLKSVGVAIGSDTNQPIHQLFPLQEEVQTLSFGSRVPISGTRQSIIQHEAGGPQRHVVAIMHVRPPEA